MPSLTILQPTESLLDASLESLPIVAPIGRPVKQPLQPYRLASALKQRRAPAPVSVPPPPIKRIRFVQEATSITYDSDDHPFSTLVRAQIPLRKVHHVGVVTRKRDAEKFTFGTRQLRYEFGRYRPCQRAHFQVQRQSNIHDLDDVDDHDAHKDLTEHVSIHDALTETRQKKLHLHFKMIWKADMSTKLHQLMRDVRDEALQVLTWQYNKMNIE